MKLHAYQPIRIKCKYIYKQSLPSYADSSNMRLVVGFHQPDILNFTFRNADPRLMSEMFLSTP